MTIVLQIVLRIEKRIEQYNFQRNQEFKFVWKENIKTKPANSSAFVYNVEFLTVNTENILIQLFDKSFFHFGCVARFECLILLKPLSF